VADHDLIARTGDGPRPDEHVVFLDGEIDVRRSGAIGDGICALVTEHPTVVVVCTSVTFIESRGLAMMARVQRFARDTGCRLVWRGLPLAALRTIHQCGLDDYLDIEA
jgi:anti-anti-sigma factor